ncbi:MAG: isocitrate lyase/PEP mutase family protein [Anaerolineales bacterium]|nr:isocitrate lyase/PEP mutase family protein [Anaerolineales bacterium]
MRTDLPSKGSAARQLRNLLAGGELIRAPSATDGLSAKLIGNAGFDAIHVTGSGVSRSMGYPDIGLVTMPEMVDRARLVANAVSIPVIADADTGYGNAMNMMRTVQEFEGAGVAAIHVEDQVTPKRCGHYERKELIPASEMALKIEAACQARRSQDFVIIARTDARGIEGFDAALARARLYRQAGADVLFIEAPETRDEIEHIPKLIDAPVLINMYSGGKTPLVSTADLKAWGYRIVVWPSHLQRASIRAMQRALELLKREDISAADDPDLMVSFAEREELVGMAEIEALERRYLRQDQGQ